MKKTLFLAAAMATCIAMAVSCKPDDSPVPDKPSEEQNDDPQPEDPESIIQIDGQFGDWSSESVAGSHAKGSYTVLEEIKGYCDVDNVYLYYKTTDISQIHNLRIMIDSDGDESTGTPGETGTYVVSCGYSLMINVTSAKSAADAACYSDLYGGDTMVGNVKMNTKAVVNSSDNSAEVEMALDRESLERLAPFEERFIRVCIFALNPSWAVCASMPSPEETDSPLIIKVNN